MTRLHTAALFVAVLAGAYAALMLINDRLTDFGVAAAICAASSVAAALFAYAGRRLSPPPDSARYAQAHVKRETTHRG